MSGTLTVGSGTVIGPTAIEVGTPAAAASAFIDFHSSGTNNDYDARLICSAGSSTSGQAQLALQAGGFTSRCQMAVQTPGSTPSSVNAALNIGYLGANTQYGLALRAAADTTTPISFHNTSDTQIGSITQTLTTTAYNTTSDMRLKEDFKSFDAGPILDEINVYDFQWKGTDKRAHGVVAQEVNKIYPLAAYEGQAQDFWGVDYSKFVPLLLQEIKALRRRIEDLER